MLFSIVVSFNNRYKHEKLFLKSFNENLIGSDAEVIAIDNTQQKISVPEALNRGIINSAGKYIILCHQDIWFPKGWMDLIANQIKLVEKSHPNWGVLGLYGIDLNFLPVGHIIDRGKRLCEGLLPCQVQTLDEVCIILRKDSGLMLNEKLDSHHLYATELCLQAQEKGLPCFAIDAPIEHISSTVGLDESFGQAVKKLRRLYKDRNVPDVICSPCAIIPIKGSWKSYLKFGKVKKIQKKIKKNRRKQIFPAYSAHQQPESYYSSGRLEMTRFIENSPKATLELGCGDGLFSFEIKSKYNAETWAIEYNPDAAKRAERFLDHVLCGDACVLIDNLPDRKFDAVFCFDFLEHLADPFTLLTKIKEKLTDQGVLIASIPNVRHYKTLGDLLFKGEWVYTNAGTLDITHLRFFTRKSIIRTFEHLGYQIERLEGIHESKKEKLKLLNFLAAGRLDDIRYLQFAVVAKPKR